MFSFRKRGERPQIERLPDNGWRMMDREQTYRRVLPFVTLLFSWVPIYGLYHSFWLAFGVGIAVAGAFGVLGALSFRVERVLEYTPGDGRFIFHEGFLIWPKRSTHCSEADIALYLQRVQLVTQHFGALGSRIEYVHALVAYPRDRFFVVFYDSDKDAVVQALDECPDTLRNCFEGEGPQMEARNA